jgi:hypothetical protein
MRWFIIAWLLCGLFWMFTNVKNIENSKSQIKNVLPDELHYLINIVTPLSILFGMIVSPYYYIKGLINKLI